MCKNKFMKKWDKEYSTQWVEEMKFLLSQNIKYDFVKTQDNVTTYKYKKTHRKNAMRSLLIKLEVLFDVFSCVLCWH